MPNFNSFDDLIQKALQSQDFPPLPKSILNTWQAPKPESAAKWLWIVPSMVFIVGIVVGVELAPLGLSNAFFTLKGSFFDAWQHVPKDAFMWALALGLAIAVLAIDGVRGLFRRLR